MLYYKMFHHAASKEWVVFIHGAGGSSAVWFKQLKDFQKHFNLLLIDLRGHGKSTDLPKAIYNQEYTFEAVTKDIIEVLDHVKLPQLTLWEFLWVQFWQGNLQRWSLKE